MHGKQVRLYLTMGFFTALLILFANLGFAAGAPVQITTNPANQGRPDVHGNIIVWKDNRAGNWDVYMYNLGGGGEQVVANTPAYQNVPATNGMMVVWQDDRNGSQDVYMRDVFLGIEQPLVTGPGNQGMAELSGNTVVYIDDHAGNNDIYSIDLTTRVIQPVCTDSANQWQPRISGSRVVWEDNRNGNWDIYMKDLATGIEQRVSTSPGDNKVADISGETVVWQNVVGGVADIRMKDIAGIEQAVTSDAAYQNSPRISGDLIVWEDYRNSNWDIYMKDLTSGGESPLASGPSTQARPAIDREKVVYEDTASGSYDVWMNIVPDTTPPVISAQTPADGQHSGCVSPVVSATYTDNRVGINTQSVGLTLDGQDVTSNAVITDNAVSYQPSALPAGQHSATMTVADLSGNIAISSWQFYTSNLELGLNALKAYWESYDDYDNRELSVPYQLLNVSTDTPAWSVEILTSTATAGVILTTPLVEIGNISPGTHNDFVLKYLIPPNTASFKTTVFASGSDTCGVTSFFPGPPPGE